LGYRELAENPFFLKLIATYWREKQTLPENQTVLFQEFSRFLLREYNPNLRGFQNLEGLTNETVESLLAHVGFAMTAHFKSIVADYDALVTYLTVSSQTAQAGFNHQKIEAVLKVAIGSRLIFRDKQNRLRFQHHRFQEYFAAYYIKAFKPTLDWEQLYDNIWWQEVLVMLFGISDEPNELMRDLLDSTNKPKIQVDKLKNTTEYELYMVENQLHSNEFSNRDTAQLYTKINELKNELERKNNLNDITIKERAQNNIDNHSPPPPQVSRGVPPPPFKGGGQGVVKSCPSDFMRVPKQKDQYCYNVLSQIEELIEEKFPERLILAARCQGNSLVKLEKEIIDILMERIIYCIKHGNRLVAVKMIGALGYIKGQSIVPFIEHLFNNNSLWVQSEALELILRY